MLVVETVADIDAATKAASTLLFHHGQLWTAKSVVKSYTKIADGIIERAEEIAFVEAVDTGQTIRFMAKSSYSRC